MSKLYGISLLLILSIVLLVGCTPKDTELRIKFETGGGLVPDDNVGRVLSITPEKMIFSTYDGRGRSTSLVERKLTTQEYDTIVKAFNDNNYWSFKEKYSSKTSLPDTGTAKLTIIGKDTVKIITIDPYDLSILPDNVKNVIEELESLINKIYDMDEDTLKIFVENFITKSPTYRSDGSGLTFIDMQILESFPPQYVLTYNFTAAEGYGDRSKIMGVRLLTEHQIIVGVTRGKIVSATIDNTYDEINQRMIGDYKIKYQPLQCMSSPWRKWYNFTVPQSMKNTSEEEMLLRYYNTIHRILLKDYKMVAGDPVIALCGEPEAYYITASVSNDKIDQMIKAGWKEISPQQDKILCNTNSDCTSLNCTAIDEKDTLCSEYKPYCSSSLGPKSAEPYCVCAPGVCQ